MLRQEAVAIALAGMLIMPDPTFRSFAVGAILVVGATVLAALMLLPAALSLLGDRVNWLTLPFIGRRGEAGNGADAVELTRKLDPNVVLMDIQMPVMNGIEATREVAALGRSETSRVLILTTFELDEYVYEALRAGASGFLLKRTPAADLVAGIRVVAAGEALLAPSVTRRLIDQFARRPAADKLDARALDALTDR